MMFGTETTVPLDVTIAELTKGNSSWNNKFEYMKNLDSELYLVHTIAREISGLSHKQKHYYDSNVVQLNNDVGDMVRRN